MTPSVTGHRRERDINVMKPSPSHVTAGGPSVSQSISRSVLCGARSVALGQISSLPLSF
jgi:hypothetical protein